MPEVRLIDANALYNDLKESVKAAREWKEEAQDEEIKIRAEQAHVTFCECALRVKNAPTIETVRHGRWINCTVLGSYCVTKHKCSECGAVVRVGNGIAFDIQSFTFCPFCGARMDAADDQEGGADNAAKRDHRQT